MITSQDCLKKFGDPKKENNLILQDVPTELEIGIIPKKIYCNKLMVKPLTNVFKELISTGLVNELKTYNGCFCIRKMTSGNSFSLHSQACAIDFNASQNGYGKKPTFTNKLVNCFKKHGFDQGGDQKVPDGMHFQLSTLEENNINNDDSNFNRILNIFEASKLTKEELKLLYEFYY